MKRALLIHLVCAAVVLSCAPPGPTMHCTSDSDCPAGFLCDQEAKTCQRQGDAGSHDSLPAPDAVWLDVARLDARGLDAATLDAAVTDIALPDSALPDAGAPDAVLPDASSPDTVLPDTAAPDTSIPDTSLPDTAAPDLALPDTSLPDLCIASCFGVCGGAPDGCGGTCDQPCAPGAWCSNQICMPCGTDDDQHCGPSCTDCVGPPPDPAGAACVLGSCGCNSELDCDYGVNCPLGGQCEVIGPNIGAEWAWDIGDRIDVFHPTLNYGLSHWYWIRVFDGSTGEYLGFMRDYHVDAGFGIYWGGNTDWPASWYRFHGSKYEFRARGLPRYVRFRFIDSDEHAYSGYSFCSNGTNPLLDLGPYP